MRRVGSGARAPAGVSGAAPPTGVQGQRPWFALGFAFALHCPPRISAFPGGALLLALVRPFRGLRYDPERLGAIDRVLAPPYDVISEAERQRLVAKSEHNIVRLTLGDQPVGTPPDERDYGAAACLLAEWEAQGLLRYDDQPAAYVYEQTYHAPPPNNELIRRRGLIMAVRLEPLGEGTIFPHEGTLAEPKEDRLRLFRATEFSFSQIFGLYNDPSKRIEQSVRGAMADPLWSFEDEHGIGQALWRVDDPAALAEVQDALRDLSIVIADGHHRYETSMAYRNLMRERHPDVSPAPWDYLLMFLCNVADKTLTIVPAHRMLRRLPADLLDEFEVRAGELFDIDHVAVPSDPAGRRAAVDELLELMARHNDGHTFGAFWGRGHAVALRLREKSKALEQYAADLSAVQGDLDVALLHAVLIRGVLGELEDLAKMSGRGNVYFERDPYQCFDDVVEGSAAMALLVNPTRVEDVLRIAEAGERMPQKGTYFWPKPLDGMVLHNMRPDSPSVSD